MNLNDLLVAYLNLLWVQLQFDIKVMSSGWMYWPLCVPAIAYLCFFACKWSFLTAPLWVPLHAIFNGWKHATDPAKVAIKSIQEKRAKDNSSTIH